MCRGPSFSVCNNCYRLTVTEKNFCHPPLIYHTERKPNPRTKKNKGGRKIDFFLNRRRLCGCPSRFAGTLGALRLASPKLWNPLKPCVLALLILRTVPCSAKPHRESRALLWLNFLQFIYQNVGCSGWFFWEDGVWYIQHLERLVLLVENAETMDMDKSQCVWGMNYSITCKNW